jgi:hypothetical protein
MLHEASMTMAMTPAQLSCLAETTDECRQMKDFHLLVFALSAQ